jgi:FOG: FHA domain
MPVIERNKDTSDDSFENQQAIEALIASTESRREKGNTRYLKYPTGEEGTRPSKRFKNDWGNERDRKEDNRQQQYQRKKGKESPQAASDNNTDSIPAKEPEKPNFGLSGALASDDKTGNTYRGVLLKFTEPPEARIPNTRWRLYVFKKSRKSTKNGAPSSSSSSEDELVEVLHISKQSAYLFGREEKVADVPVYHPSLSKQHCVLQYRALPDKSSGRDQQRVALRCRPYLMDLGSTNGTFINGVRLDEARYYELKKGDVITLGSSSREYVLLTENTTAQDL